MFLDDTKLPFNFPKTNHTVSIELLKTIRLDREVHNGVEVKHSLPPGLGNFKFYMHVDQKIVPMSEKKALWFNFRLSTNGLNVPYAVKILAGGINAISGETESGADVLLLKNNRPGTGTGQNYLILPSQLWLDGFETEDGGIQFIVIPPTQAVIAQAEFEAHHLALISRSVRSNQNQWD